MNLLDRLEQTIERVIEGSTSRVFRQSIQPAEIGRKLERAMIGNQRVWVGTAIVPNDYVVELHPKDYAKIAEYAQGLARQMESWLAEVAGQRGFTVVDRIRVRFEESRRAGVHHPRVRATITDHLSGAGKPSPRADANRTEVFQSVRRPTDTSCKLRVLSGTNAGQELAIEGDRLTVGRAEDNDLILDAPDVSRRHAQIELVGGKLRVVDLNSTNGTRVNGTAISVFDVTPGDEIAFGEQRVQVVSRTRRRFSTSAGKA